MCDFYLTLFEELDDGAYERSDEHQMERCYSLDEIKNALLACGFEFLGVWSDYGFSEIRHETERWYIAARAIKNKR